MHWTNVLLLCSSTALARGIAERSQPSITTTTWPAYQPTNAPMFQLSNDSQFAFYLEEVLSLAGGAGASTGEVLRIATQIVPRDFESTYTAFNYMAEKIDALAQTVNVTKDPIAARDAYFRAATYYRGADFFLIGNWSDPRNYDLWDKQYSSFNKALALLAPVPGERFEVDAHSPNIGNFKAIGIFYKACPGSEARPTVVIGGGYDSSQEETYHAEVRQILARGLNVVTYEGPGQPTVRRYQGLGFIPDWWNVVTPVVDYLATRPDVDMSKLALEGLSYGGSLVLIGASREPRFSALIAIDGLPSMRQAISQQLPKKLLELYASGNKTAFDETLLSIAADETEPSEFRWLIDQSLWAFNTHSPYNWWTRLGDVKWTSEMVKNISVPVFVGKGQDDLLTLQEPELANHMLITERPNGKDLTTFHEFRTDVGAGEHCQLGAESHLAQVTMDWLSDVWGGMTFENTLT